MCGGATARKPEWGPSRNKSDSVSQVKTFGAVPDALSQSFQPIQEHLCLQQPSDAVPINHALARAQAEAAMWRANFEEAQGLAQEANARYQELITHVNRGAKQGGQQPEALPPPEHLSVAPRTVTSFGGGNWLGGVTRSQPQNSSDKQEKDLATTSAWNLPSNLDLDATSNKEVATGLSDLDFLSFSACQSLGPASSEITSRLIIAPPGVEKSAEFPIPPTQTSVPASAGLLYAPSAEGVPTESGFSREKEVCGSRVAAVGGETTAVDDKGTVVKGGLSESPLFGSQTTAPLILKGIASACNQSGVSMEGHMLQHPGVTPVRRTRQQAARSRCDPHTLSASSLPLQQGGIDRKEILSSELQSPAQALGGATCPISPSSNRTRGPFDGFKNKGEVQVYRAHEAQGAKRPTKSEAVSQEEMGEVVVEPRRRHPRDGKRQPLYARVGKALTFRRSTPRGSMYCSGGGGTCTKRPSYGFPRDSRPTCCGTHKEAGMEDLISARCDFPGCRTIASYGLQTTGTHVIRRTRCKAHRTPQMSCGTKGFACNHLGGCDIRPSYGWGGRFDGEQPPRPERCKRHSSLGMEYMGSAARGKRRKPSEVKEQIEPAPAVSPPVVSPQSKQVPSGVEPMFPPLVPIVRPARKCAPTALMTESGDVLNGFEEQPKSLARAGGHKRGTLGGSKGECAPSGSCESHMVAVPGQERTRSATTARLPKEDQIGVWRDLVDLGDFKGLQESKGMDDRADRQIWGIRPHSPGQLSAFDSRLFV